MPAGLGLPPVEQRRAGGGDEHDPPAGRSFEDRVDHLEHDVVGPVQVGQHDHDRFPVGPAVEQREQRAVDLLPGPGGVDAGQRALVAEQVEDAVGDPGDLVDRGRFAQDQSHRAGDLVAGRPDGLALGDAEPVAHRLGDRPPHVRLAVGDATAFEHDRTVGSLGPRRHLLGQPGLAHARPRRSPAGDGPARG